MLKSSDTSDLQAATDRFWIERGLEIGKTGDPFTGTDPHRTKIQIEAVKAYLDWKDCVLDVGCGIGESTLAFAQHVSHVTGIELSSSLWKIAEEKRRGQDIRNVSFLQGDIRELTLEETFDKAISIQCLINLMSFEEQKKALRRIHRSLKKGGMFLLFEGTDQGLQSLNRYRETVGLKEIKVTFHNRFFDEDQLLEFMKDGFRLEKKEPVLATYFFLSYVFHPLFVSPKEPERNSRMNEISAIVALTFPGLSDIGHVPLYVWRKL